MKWKNRAKISNDSEPGFFQAFVGRLQRGGVDDRAKVIFGLFVIMYQNTSYKLCSNIRMQIIR